MEGNGLRFAWLLILMIGVCVAPRQAQAEGDRPKVALVLSGGGARGAAHAGVIQVLEELHVPIDYVVGTSMGAIVGGLYAIGTPADDLANLPTRLDWEDVFHDKIPRENQFYRRKAGQERYQFHLNIDARKGLTIPTGLMAGKKLDLTLRTLTLGAGEDFDAFPIPFRAVAADLETGEMVVLEKGDLARALRASMAIPAAFPPVEIDGRMLVDGGVARNLGVDVARQMGADVVIAVNIGTPLAKRDKLQNFLDVTDQTTGFLTNRNVDEQLKGLREGDILLTPDMGDISTASFTRMAEAVQIGKRAAEDAAEALKRYAVSPEEYAAIRQDQCKASPRPGPLEFYDVKGKEILNADIVSGYIKRRIEKVKGKPPAPDDIAQAIFEVYDRADLENIDFKLVKRHGKQGLLLEPKGKDHLQHNFNFGLQMSNDFQGRSIYDMLVEYSLTRINALGAEWTLQMQSGETRRYFTEFYQPLAPGAWRTFLAAYGEYAAQPLNIYEHTKRIAEYERDTAVGGIDFGLQLAEYGELRLGLVGGTVETGLETGDPNLPDQKYHLGAYKTSLVIDQLDSISTPRTGIFLRSEFLAAETGLRSDEDIHTLKLTALKPFSLGRNTLIVRGRWESVLSRTEDLNEVFFLGGFLNLSGLTNDQLYGRHLVFGQLIYTWRLLKQKVFGNDLFMGVSGETGNVWQRRSEFSTHDLMYAGCVFLGADSLIGPIHMGYGYAEGGYQAVYFNIGFSF